MPLFLLYGECAGPSQNAYDWNLAQCMKAECFKVYEGDYWNRTQCAFFALDFLIALTIAGGPAYSNGHNDCCNKPPLIA
jgi:hypothetical protein